MFWKAVLPEGRVMNIKNEVYELLEERNAGGALFSVTLQVNQESRRETLRHYEIFRTQDFPSEAKKLQRWMPHRPICFSPTRY
ncbi:MAG: hypothetical protein CL912_30965 [Deltaproteobacteria bacterium]|nr:hypothetical protein [Deltaproteobacteria bacterium]